MGILRRTDRRSETRVTANFAVTIWGVDTRGERFLQEARVRDMSLSGALLTGIDADLRCGDVIGVLYLGRKARYRVIWLRYDDDGDKLQAAIHRVQADACPWENLLEPDAASANEPIQDSDRPSNWR